MAVGIHVARIGPKLVNDFGVILDKNEVTIKQHAAATTDFRILVDSSIPNTTGFPTVSSYLILEAASNYVLKHLDQTFCITYNQTDINAA